ncbi:meprin A subunit beta-like [Protopterus annectens]|uniref:meprin A subunit beta-like n=1 Tax=Protopterus annectens TaxID=7888 RepID=UPI001CF9E698|nr:meprin A subunit beta-like [Protopterus annectens]
MNAKGLILKAFDQYRLKSCIDFRPWEGEKDYIAVIKGRGCWSYVGNLHIGRQELSVGSDCDRISIIEHEFLHALGFWHEHSRSDRDDYVIIMWDRIETGKEHNFQKYDENETSSLNVPYDYTSVMHYSKTAFQNGSEPTIVTRMPEFKNVIGQNLEFSDFDIQKLNRLYGCTSSITFMEQCSFELPNICGMIQNSSSTASWQRVSMVSAGPSTDHTFMGACKGYGYFMHFSTRTGTEMYNAFLETRILYPKRGLQCLQFYYYNSGNENDTLNIFVREYSGNHFDSHLLHIGNVTGKTLGFWQLQMFQLNVTKKFRVVFQGVKGHGASDGGISIDDINLSETQCPTHIWFIRNFTFLLNTSAAGDSGRIYSPRFYSKEGYGFQIGLYVNGTTERPSNLAVYFHLTSGIDDSQMQWPCPWKQVTMLLLDQNPDIRHCMSNQRSITTDPTEVIREGSSAYYFWDNPSKTGIPVTDPNGEKYFRGPGKGTSAFITHDRLHSRDYIKGDGVYLLITMEVDIGLGFGLGTEVWAGAEEVSVGRPHNGSPSMSVEACVWVSSTDVLSIAAVVGSSRGSVKADGRIVSPSAPKSVFGGTSDGGVAMGVGLETLAFFLSCSDWAADLGSIRQARHFNL